MNSYSKWQVYDYYGAKVEKVTRKNIRGFESELKQTKAYAINLLTGERIGHKKSEKEEDELMNMETGEVEKVERGEDKMLAEILIFSGEGETGTWKEYKGKDSDRAIKLRLTKERCNGDRWAKAYRHIGDGVYQNIYNTNDCRDFRNMLVRGQEDER